MKKQMRSKGFTLIELLAVVVLLGIVALIAVPSVTYYLTSSEASAYEMTEQNIVAAAYNMFADCAGNSDSEVCSAYSVPDPNSYVTVQLSTLINGGYLAPVVNPDNQGEYCNADDSYAIIMNGATENDFNAKLDYKVCLTCGDYQSSDCRFYEDRSDKIINPADFSLEQCTDFNAFLTENGIDLTGKAVIFGEDVSYDVLPNPSIIDTTKVGTFNVNYTFGTLSAVTRVTVTDVTNPSKPGVQMTSGGEDYDGTSWTNQDVIVTFTARDDTVCGHTTVDGSGVQGYKYSKDNGASWTFVESGYTESETFNGDVLVKVIDNEGNEGETNRYHIMLDKTPPTCVSTGGRNDWALEGSIVLTGTCTDADSGCKETTIQKTYDSGIESSTESPGTVYDIAGNSTVCPANQTVKIDKTPPTCVSSGGSTSWTNQNVTIVGTCSDSGSGCVENVSKLYETSTSMNITNAGPGTVYDRAGNSTVCPNDQTVRIDKVAPTYTITPSGTRYGSGYQSGLVVSVSCSDAHSGIASGSQSQTFTTRGNHSVSGTCIDNVGNRVNYSSGNFLVYVYGANASACGTYSYACGSYACRTYACEWGEKCLSAHPIPGDPLDRWQCDVSETVVTKTCTDYCTSYCTGTNSCWY